VAGAANGDHTAWTRYAAHRARLAIDLRAVLLASGQRQLGAALRAGDERALTLSGRQASLSSTLAETRELGTWPAQGRDPRLRDLAPRLRQRWPRGRQQGI